MYWKNGMDRIRTWRQNRTVETSLFRRCRFIDSVLVALPLSLSLLLPHFQFFFFRNEHREFLRRDPNCLHIEGAGVRTHECVHGRTRVRADARTYASTRGSTYASTHGRTRTPTHARTHPSVVVVVVFVVIVVVVAVLAILFVLGRCRRIDEEFASEGFNVVNVVTLGEQSRRFDEVQDDAAAPNATALLFPRRI